MPPPPAPAPRLRRNNSPSDETREERKKRRRRTKNEVERTFMCPVNDCGKAYGSENSLNQHIKLKHAEIWAQYRNQDYGEIYMDKSKDVTNSENNLQSDVA